MGRAIIARWFGRRKACAWQYPKRAEVTSQGRVQSAKRLILLATALIRNNALKSVAQFSQIPNIRFHYLVLSPSSAVSAKNNISGCYSRHDKWHQTNDNSV